MTTVSTTWFALTHQGKLFLHIKIKSTTLPKKIKVLTRASIKGFHAVDVRKVSQPKSEKKVVVPNPTVPTDNRINLNTLTAEGLTQVLPGVGIKTAKEIIDLKQGLPGEKFTKLDQLKAVKRIDWDEVFATGDVFVE